MGDEPSSNDGTGKTKGNWRVTKSPLPCYVAPRTGRNDFMSSVASH